MSIRQRAMKMGIILLVLLVVAGLCLLFTGHDAVVQAMKIKSGILTAEQVKVSFNSVSGKLQKEAVQEAQEVKKGDVLLVLDSTDVDLNIEKLQAQIGQLEAQIRSGSGNIDVGFAKADTDEAQSLRQVDQQKAAVNAAVATYDNAKLDYDRKVSLEKQGAISRSALDAARMTIQVAAADVSQQRHLLAKLLGGAADTGDTNSLQLPTIANERQTLENQKNDVQALVQQKKYLEVQLKEARIQKERLTLRAPEDAKVLKILAKQGEMVSANTPVILLESKRDYYDIYVSEKQAAHLTEGGTITGTTVATDKKVPGTIRFITQAPGFADLKNSREKGQSDLSSFQIRIYTQPGAGVRPGMTIEVSDAEFTKR
jgi:HlyD family secretion protein